MVTKTPLPAWLERHAKAFQLLQKFVKGDSAVKAEMQAAFNAAMEDDNARGPVSGALGTLVVIKGLPPSIFAETLSSNFGAWMASVSEHFLLHAKAVGHQIKAFTKEEGREIWEALEDRAARTETSDLVDFLAARTSPCPGCPLRGWAYQEKKDDRERPRPSDRRAELQAQIKAIYDAADQLRASGDRKGAAAKEQEAGPLEVELEKLEGPKPDRKAELQARLDGAKARKAEALVNEDGDAIKAAKAEIAEIEAELAKLAGKPAPPQPPADPQAAARAQLEAEILSAAIADKTKKGLLGMITAGKPLVDVRSTLETIASGGKKK